jgi:hypothetical protein
MTDAGVYLSGFVTVYLGLQATVATQTLKEFSPKQWPSRKDQLKKKYWSKIEEKIGK